MTTARRLLFATLLTVMLQQVASADPEQLKPGEVGYAQMTLDSLPQEQQDEFNELAACYGFAKELGKDDDAIQFWLHMTLGPVPSAWHYNITTPLAYQMGVARGLYALKPDAVKKKYQRDCEPKL